MAKVRIVVDLEGGLINGVFKDNPEVEVEVIVADYDTEGADDSELTRINHNGSDQEFYGTDHGATLNQEYVGKVYAALAQPIPRIDLHEAGERLSESYGGFWGVHPDYGVGDWCRAVEGDDTRLGYWEWVVHEIELAAENEEEDA